MLDLSSRIGLKSHLNAFLDAPSTAIALFAYGGIEPETNQCLVADAYRYGSIAGGMSLAKKIPRDILEKYVPLDDIPNLGAPITYLQPQADALISRSRAKTAEQFVKLTDAEVLIMIDHDISWIMGSKLYQGDLMLLAQRCAQTRSVVGGMVSKKCKNQGFPIVAKDPKMKMEFGVEELIEVTYIGSPFTAYHRDVVEAVMASTEYIPNPGFYPMFAEMVCDNPMPKNPDEPHQLHLSEDWAFCERARRLGFKIWLETRCLTKHVGHTAYTVMDSGCVIEEK